MGPYGGPSGDTDRGRGGGKEAQLNCTGKCVNNIITDLRAVGADSQKLSHSFYSQSSREPPVSQPSESKAVYLNGMVLLAPPDRMEVNLQGPCWLGGPSSHFSHSHARDPKYIKCITAAH